MSITIWHWIVVLLSVAAIFAAVALSQRKP
jgi:hypothetical protein